MCIIVLSIIKTMNSYIVKKAYQLSQIAIVYLKLKRSLATFA